MPKIPRVPRDGNFEDVVGHGEGRGRKYGQTTPEHRRPDEV